MHMYCICIYMWANFAPLPCEWGKAASGGERGAGRMCAPQRASIYSPFICIYTYIYIYIYLSSLYMLYTQYVLYFTDIYIYMYIYICIYIYG